MRGIVALAAAAITATTLAGCATPDAGDTGGDGEVGGTVTFYTDLDPQEAQPLIDEFTAETGIQIELFTGGSAAVLARWESEAAAQVYTVDVVNMSGAAGYARVAGFGLNAPIPDSVDFLEDDRPANAFDPDRMWFSTTATVPAIVYNPNNVDESDAPETWEDLLDPAYTDDLTIGAPISTVAQATYYQMREEPTLGEEFLEDLAAQNPAVSPKSGDVVSAIVTGDTLVGIANDNAAWAQIGVGAPLKVVYPEVGQPVLTNYVMLAAESPNPDAAAVFMNYLASKAAGEIYAMTGAYSALSSVAPVGEGRPSLDELTAWPIDPATFVGAQTEMVPLLEKLFG
jgi:iron(III) transport system substrate-binding protein